jgi:chorismate dehydratase
MAAARAVDLTARAPARPRYGAVPYLNAKPLLEGLEEEVGPLRLEVPALLTGLLREGELDVALAPVVAAFEMRELRVVDGAAICTKGAVGSVLLFSKVPLQEARVVALDASSRTSSALARVLFRHRWKASPRYVERPPDPDLRRLEADAALLIGDPALLARWEGPPPVDLGHEWCAWTGLPFVFAAWLARTDVFAAAAAKPLARAAERGRLALDAIARRGAAPLGLEGSAAKAYLGDRLSYAFGPVEREGMERFRGYWAELSGRD